MQEFQYIQDALKDDYAPAMVNQINKKAALWAQIKKTTKGVAGKRCVIPVVMGLPEGIGARAANNYNIPDAQRASYDQAYIYMKRNYGRVMVDGFSIESSKGKGGWVDLFTNETKLTTDAFAMDMDRQSIGDGSGVLAWVASINGQIITVDHPGGVASDTPVTKFFRKGQVLDIYRSTVKEADSVQITSIDATAGTITVTGTISACADNDVILREDTYQASGNGEIAGIRLIASDDNLGSDFEGIDRTANPEWCSYVKTSAGALTETLIQEQLDQIEQNTDGSAPNLALTTFAIRNKLIATMQGDRQVTTLDLKAGWKAIKYIGGNVELPILCHKNLDTGRLYLLSLDHLRHYVLQDLTWENKGGGIIRPVSGKDAYEASFRQYSELGTDCPNAHGNIVGITVA